MRFRSQRSSVVLVALSCVTVLGIAMASFLTAGNLAMKLSNRSYAKEVSKQLAEMGLEQALRAFSNNATAALVASGFSGWTLSGITATNTLTIASSLYGNSGITAAINIRVDHYLNTKKTTPWNVLTTYALNDFVWYQGSWYLCISAPPANQAPSNTTYWKSAPEVWSPYPSYEIGNIALFGGTAYRCIKANVNTTPPNATYWTAYGVIALNGATSYGVDDVVLSGGTPYRCILAHTNHLPPDTTYWLSAPVIYSEGVATLPGNTGPSTIKTQLHATLAPAALFSNALGATTLVNLATTGTVDSYNTPLTAAWSAATAYLPGTVVLSGTTLYRCILASTNNVPPNTTYWLPMPLGSSAVVAGGNTAGTAVTLTSARVNGYVSAPSSSTSPYAPLWSTGASAVVTSSMVAATPATKIDLTRVSRSPFVPQFDVQSPPYATYLMPSTTGTTSLPGGGDAPAADGKYYYYTSGDLFLTTGDTLNINGPVVIDIKPTSTADLYIQGTGKIVINTPTSAPVGTNASLEIHFGDELYIGSNSGGGIQNLTLDPKRCIILGTSTINSSGYHYFWSNVPFYGVLYMPNAYVHVWNSGYNEQIYGAFSAKNIYFNHTVNFHYDTSLRTAVISGVDAPYRLTEWRELTDPSEQVTLP